MADLLEKMREIEAARLLLHQLVMAKNGNMIDPEVAEMSIRLDKLIVEYENTKNMLSRKEVIC